MTFKVSDYHIEEYHRHGYTVFRNILPTSLICDMRRVADVARDMAREKNGPQVQRLQPVANYALELQPFKDYAELPELIDAIVKVLTPHHQHTNPQVLGILFEPAEMPYCTVWHRDWRDNAAGLDLAMWDEVFGDINCFNQVNCALYQDHCTWLVPGSHLRQDLPREIERFPDRPIVGPNLQGKTSEEREQLCLEYCQSMPGAVQLHLEAGDFALYRNTLWHLGNYVPYCKRATLHDVVDTPAYVSWRTKAMEVARKRREAGFGMENPNKRVDG